MKIYVQSPLPGHPVEADCIDAWVAGAAGNRLGSLTSEKWYSHQLFYISFPLLVPSQLAFNVVDARVNVGCRVNRSYFCNSLHWGCGPWQLHKNKGWKVWIYTPAIWVLLPRLFLRCLSTSMPKCYDCFSLSNVKAAFGLMQAVTASSSTVFCW